MNYCKVEVLPSVTFKIGFMEPVSCEVPQSDRMFVAAASWATMLLRDSIEDAFNPTKLRSLGLNALTIEFIENNEANIEFVDADSDEKMFYTVNGNDIQY